VPVWGASGGINVCGNGWRLSAQRLAALRAAGIDDLAARFGRHTGTEPVAALADEVRGLKGAFHRSVSI